ncbi:hypothetical protein BDV93DRAFT_511450 [Ceratobasidium sp. AG-I]|nr:hypothetical protein BDV93DRAFT_511450 [Ceratobasidium sp. AG-I]
MTKKGMSVLSSVFLSLIHEQRGRALNTFTNRDLSLVFHSQSPPPTPPAANLPYHPPAALDPSLHAISQATSFLPIQPFGSFSHLDDPVEDLPNAENTWEVNWALTYARRSAAQHLPTPQLPTYAPTDHWNPHQWMHSGGNHTHPPQPPQPPQPQSHMDQVAWGSTEILNRAPVSPPVAGPSNRRDSLGSRSTSTYATSMRGGRRRRGSIPLDPSEKKFKCEACGRSYSRKAELDRHQKTDKKHNGIGKYPCKCCGRWFTRDDARLRHERLREVGEGSGRSGKGKERDIDMDVDDDEEDI